MMFRGWAMSSVELGHGAVKNTGWKRKIKDQEKRELGQNSGNTWSFFFSSLKGHKSDEWAGKMSTAHTQEDDLEI